MNLLFFFFSKFWHRGKTQIYPPIVLKSLQRFSSFLHLSHHLVIRSEYVYVSAWCWCDTQDEFIHQVDWDVDDKWSASLEPQNVWSACFVCIKSMVSIHNAICIILNIGFLSVLLSKSEHWHEWDLESWAKLEVRCVSHVVKF